VAQMYGRIKHLKSTTASPSNRSKKIDENEYSIFILAPVATNQILKGDNRMRSDFYKEKSSEFPFARLVCFFAW